MDLTVQRVVVVTTEFVTQDNSLPLAPIDERLGVIDRSAFQGVIVMKRERIRDSSSPVSIVYQLPADTDDGINLFSQNQCEGYTFPQFLISVGLG